MSLFGGKLPEVSIQLERADGVYYPGEAVRARVTIAAEDGAKFKEIRAGLLFEEKYQIIDRRHDSDGHVSYNHVWNTDEQWAAREQLASNGFPKGFRQTYDYEWRLPDDPHPYCQAKILQARWLVKATVDRTLARDVNAEAPLYVVAPAPAQASQGGESVDENTAPDVVQMRFQLPRLEYVQGKTVAGRVLIEPRQDLNPRSLNLSLLRHEVVPGGDRTNIENVFERQQQFGVQLRAGQPSRSTSSSRFQRTGARHIHRTTRASRGASTPRSTYPGNATYTRGRPYASSTARPALRSRKRPQPNWHSPRPTRPRTTRPKRRRRSSADNAAAHSSRARSSAATAEVRSYGKNSTASVSERVVAPR